MQTPEYSCYAFRGPFVRFCGHSGIVFRVLNRGVGRMPRFLEDAEFEAFERVKKTAKQLRTCFEIRHTLTPTLCPVQVGLS